MRGSGNGTLSALKLRCQPTDGTYCRRALAASLSLEALPAEASQRQGYHSPRLPDGVTNSDPHLEDLTVACVSDERGSSQRSQAAFSAAGLREIVGELYLRLMRLKSCMPSPLPGNRNPRRQDARRQ